MLANENLGECTFIFGDLKTNKQKNPAKFL